MIRLEYYSARVTTVLQSTSITDTKASTLIRSKQMHFKTAQSRENKKGLKHMPIQISSMNEET